MAGKSWEVWEPPRCSRQSPPGLVVNLAASFVVASCRKAPAAKPARLQALRGALRAPGVHAPRSSLLHSLCFQC